MHKNELNDPLKHTNLAAVPELLVRATTERFHLSLSVEDVPLICFLIPSF